MAFHDEQIIGGSASNPQSPLSGAIDGSNATFTFNPPLNNLFLNQGFQTPNVDYTKSGTSLITVVFTVPPPVGSVIYAT